MGGTSNAVSGGGVQQMLFVGGGTTNAVSGGGTTTAVSGVVGYNKCC